jgi:hypothetical protein
MVGFLLQIEGPSASAVWKRPTLVVWITNDYPLFAFSGHSDGRFSDCGARQKVWIVSKSGFLRRVVKIDASLYPKRPQAKKTPFYRLIAHRMLLHPGLSGIKQRSFLGARFLHCRCSR